MASKILRRRIRKSAVELVLNSVVTEIFANEDGVNSFTVTELSTGRRRIIDTEGVFILISLLPNNQVAPPGIQLDCSGYAITDDKCGTGIPGIHIAGDLRPKYAKHIVVSAAEGCTAALAAAEYIDEKKNVMGAFDIETTSDEDGFKNYW